MKLRLLAVVIGIIAILGTSVPVMADNVNTNATVGAGGTPPYVILVTMTPDDDTVAAGVDVLPEPAVPVGGSFAALPAGQDGWKRVKFYVMANHDTALHTAINLVTIDVYYPEGPRKFELDAMWDGSGWVAAETYNSNQYYPAVPATGVPLQATVPGWSVRELQYGDYVDVNADEILGPSPDQTVQPFLNSWGSRVTYAQGWDAASAGAQLQSDQALMLELTGYIWFHQPACTYTIEAKASTGIMSDPLVSCFDFIPIVSLYLDFTDVNYGAVDPTQERTFAPGDPNLNTPNVTTIWNNGNINAEVLVSSTKMVLNWDGEGPTSEVTDYDNISKTIDDFDAALYFKDCDLNNVQVGYITYTADSEPVVIENTGAVGTPVTQMGELGPVLLQSCRPAKIEFSIEPEPFIVNGSYGGRLTIALCPYSGSQCPIDCSVD